MATYKVVILALAIAGIGLNIIGIAIPFVSARESKSEATYRN